MHRPSLLTLAVLAALAVGARCPGALDTVVVDAPLEGALFEDPAAAVAPAARLGTNFKLPSVAVKLDGVDLLDALGLTPPFADASGVVSIGGIPVSISGFRFTTAGERKIDFVAAGLPPGDHDFEVEALRNDDVLVADGVGFQVSGPLALAAEVLSGGALRRPQLAGAEGILFDTSLGQPLAAPPLALSGGGALRQGFVPVAEARIEGGTP